MVKVIGVRFRTAGKIYYFDPLNFQVKRGDHVIVETARGVEYGTVVGSPREVEDDKVVQPLKPVLRVATERDDEQEAGNKAKEKEAFKICQEKIRKHGLEMKLIDAEYTFDNNKVLFYFTADGRVDFRELVKDLAGMFRTRIELRQIGVRDETKILGGIGIVLANIWLFAADIPSGWQDALTKLLSGTMQGIICAACSVYTKNIVKQYGKRTDGGKDGNGGDA